MLESVRNYVAKQNFGPVRVVGVDNLDGLRSIVFLNIDINLETLLTFTLFLGRGGFAVVALFSLVSAVIDGLLLGLLRRRQQPVDAD